MYALKKKTMLLLATTTLVMLAYTLPVEAAHISLFGYTDKPQYKAGEKGTLKIWLYNDGTEDVVLKNVTVEYPWHGHYVWEGNETIKNVNTAITVKGNWSTSLTFTIPSDGRATGGFISIRFVTDKLSDTETIYLNVASVPSYLDFKDSDKMLTLFTVLVVLIIVCSAIIAAAIFLSARKSQVVWSKEKE